MIITYYGVSCFKIQSGDLVLAFDPSSKESTTKPPRFQADIVFSSHNHPRHNGLDNLNPKAGQELFSVSHPGEYEIKKIYIQGIPCFHDSSQGKKYGLNTIYRIVMEDLTFCHLGDFGEKELRSETEEKINGVDVLFAPIGGDTVLDPASAARLINQISPGLVIPMHYETEEKGNKILEEFFNEMGLEEIKPVDKLSVRKKDFSEGDRTKVAVFKSLISG
ncbi:MAG: Zn-dependent hydrolase of the beta-lactamase fold-like protein [Parcubacteria group bacterium GW2011_GWC2_42_13]|nr:MAG: Zn-dependent hydrolase of the beta-lactamase fold-like protein [Parcubacteria group bacterium GW2011_GWC2_42_13]